MKSVAPRNRTLTCTDEELKSLSAGLCRLNEPATVEQLADRIVNQELEEALPFLPEAFVDLLILDPPYNLTKNYHGYVFRSREAEAYAAWFNEVLVALLPTLKPDASLYVCSDWTTSNLVFPILDRRVRVRNRITWGREKGRGAKTNWKNNTEDIWFCTVGDDYCFNVDDVMLKRRVLAPYRTEDGCPKDWVQGPKGQYRLTYPSNFWSDITIPFWSMPENTDHPTQKPEKLIAKLILASSIQGGFVFDPFLGSGTTAVVARKLNRRFCGIELNTEYCCWAAKRLALAAEDSRIQGYANGVFWDRNSLRDQQAQQA
jgi:site-specific DNA-methyltransferase (adenine-specific)